MYTNLHSLTQSLRVPSPGGIGVLNEVLYGEARSARWFKHSRLYTHFYQNSTPFIYLKQNCTPFLYLKDNPKLYNFLQLTRSSRTFSRSDQLLKGCKLSCVISAKIWHPFSHHFFHFTADFVNLYTKMAIFPTL